jgi:hypothetical protein
MKIEDRIAFDNICDYIPIVSTFNSIVDLWQKHAYQKNMTIDPQNPIALKCEYWNAYRVKILHKKTDRCLILLVPVLGNIYIGICDLLEKCC